MSRERPSHKCFVVEDRGDGKEAFWTRIGSAWPHKDGKGFNVQLSALPASGGRIVLREIAAIEEEESTSGSRSSALTEAKEPELAVAGEYLRTAVREASSALKKRRRTGSGTAS